MNHEYVSIFDKVAAAGARMGFHLVRDEAFEADFGRADGWHVLIEGDSRVRGSFNLVIRSYNGRVFVVRLLMQAFGDGSQPSLDNQIKFMENHQNEVFDQAMPYRAAYDQVDRIE